MLKFKVDLEVLISECTNYAQYMYLFYKKYGKGPHWIDAKSNPEKAVLYECTYKSEQHIYDMESLIGIPYGISMQVYRIAENFYKRTSGETLFPTEKVFASLIGGDQE